MPITKAAKKAMRVSYRRREINLVQLRKIRLARREINKLVKSGETGDSESVKQALANYYSALDKAVKKGIIHKNKASRLKSRAVSRIKRSQVESDN
jgi:small subunit ribosomal protein S20